MKISKIFFLASIMLAGTFANAQTKYNTRNGFVGFFSHTPLEDIKGDNNQVSALLNIEDGEYNFLVLIKSFELPKALMQEHFNEDYMESDKFPKSTFTGKIKDISKIDFKKDGEYAVIVEGNLTMKDKTNPVSVPGTIIIKDDKIESKAKFIIKPFDYNVEIPSMVKDKIAKEIEISVDVIMSQMIK